MLAVAVVGLVVNIVAWRLLRRGSEESLNVEGAYLEVLADLIGSVAVIVAAVIISITGWTIVDPIIAAAIGLFILPRAWRLAPKGPAHPAPSGPRPPRSRRALDRLRAIPDVVDVHDLHVWTLTSDMDVGTVHLMTRDTAESHPILDAARVILQQNGIAHATLQVEPESHTGCAELNW